MVKVTVSHVRCPGLTPGAAFNGGKLRSGDYTVDDCCGRQRGYRGYIFPCARKHADCG
jgi:hypothetical protein